MTKDSVIKQKKQHLIIDTDCGLDDICALLLLLHYHHKKHLSIDLITIVQGAQLAVETSYDHLVRMLDHCGFSDIEIHAGKGVALREETFHSFMEEKDSWYNEEVRMLTNEFCKVFKIKERTKKETSEVAVERLVEVVDSKPDGYFTLITLGPFTNIAKAIELAKNKNIKFLEKLESIYMMAGNLNLKETNGNTPNNVSEWNVYADATAARITYEAFNNLPDTVPIYMHGLEVANLDILTIEEHQEVAKLAREKLSQLKSFDAVEHKIADLLCQLLTRNHHCMTFDPLTVTAIHSIPFDTVPAYEDLYFHEVLDDVVENHGKIIVGKEGKRKWKIGVKHCRDSFRKIVDAVLLISE